MIHAVELTYLGREGVQSHSFPIRHPLEYLRDVTFPWLMVNLYSNIVRDIANGRYESMAPMIGSKGGTCLISKVCENPSSRSRVSKHCTVVDCHPLSCRTARFSQFDVSKSCPNRLSGVLSSNRACTPAFIDSHADSRTWPPAPSTLRQPRR